MYLYSEICLLFVSYCIQFSKCSSENGGRASNCECNNIIAQRSYAAYIYVYIYTYIYNKIWNHSLKYQTMSIVNTNTRSSCIIYATYLSNDVFDYFDFIIIIIFPCLNMAKDMEEPREFHTH